LDLLTTFGDKRQMEMSRLFAGSSDAQGRLAVCAEFDSRCAFRDYGHANGRECLEKKRSARSVVADSEYDMVEHEFSRFLDYASLKSRGGVAFLNDHASHARQPRAWISWAT
jgi:hypothetical protein